MTHTHGRKVSGQARQPAASMACADGVLTLMHRADLAQDGESRPAVEAALRADMREWCHRAARVSGTQPELLVARAWELFWQRCASTRKDRLTNLAAVRAYLLLCVGMAATALPHRDSREDAIVILRYREGLSASAIQARRPDLFPTVGDVYRAGRATLERQAVSLVLQEPPNAD
jgi:hypothetical protein